MLREVAARHIPADASKGKAQMLWDGLKDDIAARLGETAAESLLPYLQPRLIREGGLILLDGLDEVPEARRRRETLLGSISEMVAALPRGRFVVTARPYAYADRRWHMKGFPVLALAPFSPEQSGRFIERFYVAVRQSMGWTEAMARDRGDRLQAALENKPYPADLAARPLLLTLMATLHTSSGQLPEDRADLMEEAVKLLLGRWQRARVVTDAHGQPVLEPGIAQCLNVGEGSIRAALESLALAVHERERTSGAEDAEPSDIPEGDVLLAFKPLLGTLSPEVLLNYLNQRAELLIARREGVYAFPHRSFQEYLAACELSNQPDFAGAIRDRVREDPKWWREVWLLGAGRVKRGGLGSVVGLMNELLPAGPAEVTDKNDLDWQLASLTGQAILECRLADKGATRTASAVLVGRCRDWLVQLIEDGQLSPRDRAEVGDVLSQLGDPRFDPNAFYLPTLYHGQAEPLLGFVEIPAGPFVMGSRDELRKPQSLEIPYRYWIARYPVTVAQYTAFVEDAGYETEKWWAVRGWAWRKGEYDSKIEDSESRDWLASRTEPLRRRPMCWGQQSKFANRPVTGVCWFEAMAYATWLTARLAERGDVLHEGYIARLPTETEWEKAARTGDRGCYAWDYPRPDWDEIGRPTTVGMYPKAATASGVHDLAGNVYAWTNTNYPYRPEAARNDPAAEGPRVLRSGSWDGDPEDESQVSHRNWLHPDLFDNYFGFRVVLSWRILNSDCWQGCPSRGPSVPMAQLHRTDVSSATAKKMIAGVSASSVIFQFWPRKGWSICGTIVSSRPERIG
jgi:formylglycine-generating enzyme required for sulfatase activity